MNREDIIRMAREAGAMFDHMTWVERDLAPVFERFSALVAAAEREKVAAWMIKHSYATGHGDSTEDLLKELEWQIAEREREACAKVCDDIRNDWKTHGDEMKTYAAEYLANAIRARGQA